MGLLNRLRYRNRRHCIDKQSLYVAPQRTPTSEIAKGIKNPTWWTRCVLFICCVSSPAESEGHQ
ncbi:hypothetical protein K503DRAFT_280779 [Rhizopogon vinicolor AM-OR11-026]|uniref:Uncharacterized protein n=1 Tax=Rhizopogon vinicolor AM-OR11-026 TaxID=1314800 RepID=A0A1B7MVT7_9AGAM|nr:hypothetical protein K503DRAFT_280779 [Rhizopogon vinicolor AM-OR11-026]